jgi:DnaJ-class molecular chaperone
MKNLIIKIMIKLFKNNICNDCKGYGLMANHKWQYFKCPKCKGDGFINNLKNIKNE